LQEDGHLVTNQQNLTLISELHSGASMAGIRINFSLINKSFVTFEYQMLQY
jgi:hypothetical protein